MSLKYLIENGVLRFSIAGRVDAATALQNLRAGLSAYDGAGAEGRRILIDVAPHAATPSTLDARTIGRTLQDETGAARVAIVAEQDLHFGLGRVIAAVGSNEVTRIRVFRARDRAHGWLDDGDD